MILTKEIEIGVNIKNIDHLKSLNYTGLTFHTKIMIPIEHLSIGSGYKIDVVCDVCGKKMKRRYHDYNKSIKNGGYFACSNKCSYSKKQITFEKKYGVKHLLQSKIILNRLKTNNKLKYGVENVNQSETIKQKKKEIFLKKYGVENPSQLESFKRKKEQTSLKNYGVKYHNQSEEYFDSVFRKSNKIRKYNIDLYYQSTYEKHFLDHCDKIGILCDIENFKSKIKYKHDNKIKYYFPDFFVKKLNLIIEIKSEYYYKKYLETNELKKEECIKRGYNYMFIIDKKYQDFEKIYYPS